MSKCVLWSWYSMFLTFWRIIRAKASETTTMSTELSWTLLAVQWIQSPTNAQGTQKDESQSRGVFQLRSASQMHNWWENRRKEKEQIWKILLHPRTRAHLWLRNDGRALASPWFPLLLTSTQVKNNGAKENPNKTNTEKIKVETSSPLNSWAKRRGKKSITISLCESRQTRRGIPQPVDYSRTRVLLGRCSPYCLSPFYLFYLMFCSPG
jgi:hypothetical protein